MSQQINLYQPLFRKPQVLLSAAAMAQMAALSLLILLAVYGFGLWRQHQQAVELARLEARQQRATQQLGELVALRLPPAPNPGAEQQVQQLAQVYDHKQQLMTILRDHIHGNTGGFGDYLEGLARQRMEGLWLTEVQIGDGGQRLSLSGLSLTPEQVPRLLARLREAPAFRGKVFQTLEMAQEEDGGGALRFTLASAAEAPP